MSIKKEWNAEWDVESAQWWASQSLYWAESARWWARNAHTFPTEAWPASRAWTQCHRALVSRFEAEVRLSEFS